MTQSDELTLNVSADGDVQIRQATPHDRQAVVQFNAALALETEGKQLDSLRLQQGVDAVLENPKHGFYVIAEDVSSRKPIGQLLITYEWSDWRNGVFWWIQSVYVHEKWRRRGVFRMLYDSIREQAKATGGIAGVRLYVEKDNHVAQQVYQELGLSSAGYHVYELDFDSPRKS